MFFGDGKPFSLPLINLTLLLVVNQYQIFQFIDLYKLRVKLMRWTFK